MLDLIKSGVENSNFLYLSIDDLEFKLDDYSIEFFEKENVIKFTKLNAEIYINVMSIKTFAFSNKTSILNTL